MRPETQADSFSAIGHFGKAVNCHFRTLGGGTRGFYAQGEFGRRRP